MAAMMSAGYLEEIGVTGDEPKLLTPPRPAAAATKEQAAAPAKEEGAGAKAAKTKEAKDAKGKDGKKAEKASKEAAAPETADAPPPAAAPEELSAEQLAKLSKEERKAYHQARRAATTTQKEPAKQLSKAERRQIQEAQRKLKEDTKQAGKDNEELLAELKLQGLSEDQAREVMKEMLKGEALEEEEDDEDDAGDFASSVRQWMSEQEDKVSKDALRDFNMKVRFQGHVDTTPPDHLGCILRLIFQEACGACDLTAPKLQPTAVAKKAGPLLTRWAPLLEPLYGKIDDVLVATDTVCKAVQEAVSADEKTSEAGRNTAMVGCFMSLRDIDMIEDEDLLTGCKRVEPRSTVLDKFIEFLEDALEEDDEDDNL